MAYVGDNDLQHKFAEALDIIRALQEELAETNRGLVALTLELEQRVDERTKELRAAHRALEESNAELQQMTLYLQTANQELEAFSYSVSHDLRTPLQAVLGFSELLAERCESQLDGQGKQYLERLRTGCYRMVDLIEDLLMLSHISRREMHHERVDLSLLAKSITSTLAMTQPRRRVSFDITEGLVTTGDTGLLRVVLENLLGNAWKFTGKKRRAHIAFGCSENPLVYFVRDNGAGFKMADAAQLFSAFQRLHSDRDYPGSGIGLATVQRIISRHSGRIWAEATVGQGATFYFTLFSE
jgi:light-regulated signal transduction histidine kinase (bacteriophytochrome)